MTLNEVFARVDLDVPASAAEDKVLWIGSAGYERFKHNADFAKRLRDAGVQRLVDVRELPISRRPGYAKTALAEAMSAVGIEYVHMRALGNPKPFRDLYKSGRAAEGRKLYVHHLVTERREALEELVPLLRDKRVGDARAYGLYRDRHPAGGGACSSRR